MNDRNLIASASLLGFVIICVLVALALI